MNSIKFPKKILGKKLRTEMVMHRLVVKFYDNGIYIKPIGNQGYKFIKKQDGIFLTLENMYRLQNYLQDWEKIRNIQSELKNEKNEEFDEAVNMRREYY